MTQRQHLIEEKIVIDKESFCSNYDVFDQFVFCPDLVMSKLETFILEDQLTTGISTQQFMWLKESESGWNGKIIPVWVLLFAGSSAPDMRVNYEMLDVDKYMKNIDRNKRTCFMNHDTCMLVRVVGIKIFHYSRPL